MDEPGITMYTTPGCGDCYVAKRTMARLGVPYREVDIRDDAGAREEVQRLNGGLRSVPTIVFPSGHVVVEPSAPQLEAVLRREGALA
ncbi:MAG TPA: glutaredoxin family protein [Candidatus Dormibacteraeota bacterium]|jgi:mycoredoxin|nr:glutaredoxin family protein [Candidatus Dormibacteraeota bacterium]